MTKQTNDAQPAEIDVRGARAIRTWGGRGSGARCVLCNRGITNAEIEYEIEAELADRLVNLRFHLECYRRWDGRILSSISER